MSLTRVAQTTRSRWMTQPRISRGCEPCSLIVLVVGAGARVASVAHTGAHPSSPAIPRRISSRARTIAQGEELRRIRSSTSTCTRQRTPRSGTPGRTGVVLSAGLSRVHLGGDVDRVAHADSRRRSRAHDRIRAGPPGCVTILLVFLLARDRVFGAHVGHARRPRSSRSTRT